MVPRYMLVLRKLGCKTEVLYGLLPHTVLVSTTSDTCRNKKVMFTPYRKLFRPTVCGYALILGWKCPICTKLSEGYEDLVWRFVIYDFFGSQTWHKFSLK